MKSEYSTPIAYDAYQELADSYAALVPTKDYNAYYDRPAILSLLEEVKDKNILDAGCGIGMYTEILLNRGAQVTGVDVSENMLAYARQRNGDKAKFLLADLEKPLASLLNAEFDGILSALTVTYVKDLSTLFLEFNRLLKPGGWFIFSTEHPFFSYTYFRLENYFEVQPVKSVWTSFHKNIEMPCYHHSLSTITDSLLNNGFSIERILEAIPTEDFRLKNPEGYEKRIKFPSFIHFKARKL
ncbi:MAG: class I SAM-dependent methyltransferase [Saprospiraceae bacterium]